MPHGNDHLRCEPLRSHSAAQPSIRSGRRSPPALQERIQSRRLLQCAPLGSRSGCGSPLHTLGDDARRSALLRLVPKGERKSLENVIEETRRSARWIAYFHEFHDPYLHLTPEQYAAAAERTGLRVLRIHTEAKAWDFKSRSAFFDFSSVGFVEWTRRLPEAERPEFINNVLDNYRSVAADRAGEENTFKFYQMDVTLAPIS